MTDLLKVRPFNRRAFLAQSVLLAAGALTLPDLLAACSQGSPSGKSTSHTLVYVDTDTPPTFDLDQEGVNGLSEHLALVTDSSLVDYKTIYDSTARIERSDFYAVGDKGIKPNLAESFEVSSDQRVFTFHLRSDAKSPLGNPLTADDVIWTIQRSIALNQTGAFFASVMGLTKGKMEKVDPQTVRFTLPTPNPLLLRVDAVQMYVEVLDSVAGKAHATPTDAWAKSYFADHTAGFGPYTVQSFQKGQQLVLATNPGWYGPKPYFDKVVWRAVPESANRLSLLLNGGADVAATLTPPQLKQAKNAPGVAVTEYESNEFTSIQLNLRSGPLADYRVRQAIAYAVPYNDILSSVYLGTAKLVKSPIPEIYPTYTDKFWSYSTNLDKARQLLHDANQGPFTITLTYDLTTYDAPLLAPILRSALKDIGISVTLNGVPPAVFDEKLYKHQGDAFIQENWPLVAHPAYALWVYWRSTSFLNIGGWTNQEFDSLVDQLLTESDPVNLQKLSEQAQQIWEREQPWIMIANPGWRIAHRKDISGLTYYTDNSVRFQQLRRG